MRNSAATLTEVCGPVTPATSRVRKVIRKSLRPPQPDPYPSFLVAADWNHIVAMLNLSPQQARIVGMILKGQQDKDIALELGLNRYTIRTYLRRVYDRADVADRMDLVLRAFSLVMTRRKGAGYPPYG